MHLDALLIAPPTHYDDPDNIWKEVNSNFPNLGLASIAAFVRSHNKSVHYIDCNIVAPSVTRFEHYFKERYVGVMSSISAIGISALTFNINKAHKLAALCKKYYPQALVVVGGTHPSIRPFEVLSNLAIDVVAIGEGEHTFLELLEKKPFHTIKGIAYRNENGTPLLTPARERITSLDDLPMIAYDLLPMSEYHPAKGSYKRLPAISVVTSRGCPGKCTFCVNALGNRLVFKSAKKIFDEIYYLHTTFGINQILFYDDTFTVFKKNVRELCTMLIEKRLSVAWTCFARVDTVDQELLLLMKKAGCHQIMYGVENINQDVLRAIQKHINKQDVIQAVRWTKAAGIECRLAFMVGNPGDTPEIIKENIAFIKEVDPDFLIVNITTPFPGTRMFAWAEEHSLLLTTDWDEYTLAKPVMRLENMSEQDIVHWYKYMYRSFYLRPSYILKKILSIRSMDDITKCISGFNAVLSFLR